MDPRDLWSLLIGLPLALAPLLIAIILLAGAFLSG